ncbi:hypothetical protein GCM10009118_18180 [Wandonia haliotis]|uniref:Uncharacterized protein n=1 Tax=Wandonia haliotis TaxID=574963 RepID=A0ABN1MRC3_9FLAO
MKKSIALTFFVFSMASISFAQQNNEVNPSQSTSSTGVKAPKEKIEAKQTPASKINKEYKSIKRANLEAIPEQQVRKEEFENNQSN